MAQLQCSMARWFGYFHFFLRHQSPFPSPNAQHSLWLENGVLYKVIKNTLCTAWVLTLLPHGAHLAWLLILNVFWAEISITNVSEKNAVWVARSMIGFSPILSFHLTTSVLALLPPLPIARCLAPSVWHATLRICIFHRAVTTGFNLTRHPWEHKVSICLFPRTRRVVTLRAGKEAPLHLISFF